MKQCASVEEIRKEIESLKKQDKTIAFVPTMGALHEGHRSLIRLAKEKADAVVVSIYVNPEQFGPNEDFEDYPRQLQQDLDACKKEGAALVFTPDDAVMYGSGTKYFKIDMEVLNEHMDGGSRPGFFEGIVLVVNKFFNIIEPDVAIFGQKDIQQFQILKQMVYEFNHGIELIAAPIARAEDGLALSSRNAYLTKEERAKAPALYKALQLVADQIKNGVMRPESLLKDQQDELKAKGFKNDYLNTFSMKTMEPVKKLEPGNQYILAGAVYLGKTRLIDNIILDL